MNAEDFADYIHEILLDDPDFSCVERVVYRDGQYIFHINTSSMTEFFWHPAPRSLPIDRHSAQTSDYMEQLFGDLSDRFFELGLY